MTTFINADTIVGGAVVTADASGQLGLQAAGSTQVTITTSGVTLANPLAVSSGGTGATSLAAAGIPSASASTTFTGANTFRTTSGTRFEEASTQDAIIIDGRAGGTSSYAVTLTPTTLSANRTLTAPDVSGTILTTGAAVTVAQGGTGSTSLTANNVLLGNGTSALQTVAPGTTGNVLTSNGTTWQSSAPAAGGFSNMTVFTSSTTWSVPAGVTKCKVTVTGGGGGVNGSGFNGSTGASGAGGTAIKIVTLSGGSATITIGAGGSGNSGGGNSQFVYSATTVTGFGGDAVTSGSANGANGGTASGGDINLTGGSGSGAGYQSNSSGYPGTGGASYWGGGGTRNQNGQAYGSGAGIITSSSTLTGAGGVIVIEY